MRGVNDVPAPPKPTADGTGQHEHRLAPFQPRPRPLTADWRLSMKCSPPARPVAAHGGRSPRESDGWGLRPSFRPGCAPLDCWAGPSGLLLGHLQRGREETAIVWMPCQRHLIPLSFLPGDVGKQRFLASSAGRWGQEADVANRTQRGSSMGDFRLDPSRQAPPCPCPLSLQRAPGPQETGQ